MKMWRTACLVSLGALIGINTVEQGHSRSNVMLWAAVFAVSVLGWGWLSLGTAVRSVLARLTYLLTGRQITLPRTDPKALADEVAALNAQIAQLRDTATSFDVSFDHTLQRLDERLRRVEQQSPYVRIHPSA